MKRLILLFFIFFLNACQIVFPQKKEMGCPWWIEWSDTLVLEYEYGSEKMNEKSTREIESIARNASYANSSVCFVGVISRRGQPQENTMRALRRAENAADLFLEVGVNFEKIYISVEPEADKVGLSAPQKASDENHLLVIRIGG